MLRLAGRPIVTVMRRRILIESGVLLPLFPLHAVLFPGSQLSIHIFETRYREMVKMCLDSNSSFVISLIASGREVGEPATAYAVGTLAEIVQYEHMPDGRYHLLCHGVQRVRVGSPVMGQPYARATVEKFMNVPEIENLDDLMQRLRSRLATLVTAMRVESSVSQDEEIDLSFEVASNMQIDLNEKQLLLEMPSAYQRLGTLLTIVEREIRLHGRVGNSRALTPSELQEISRN